VKLPARLIVGNANAEGTVRRILLRRKRGEDMGRKPKQKRQYIIRRTTDSEGYPGITVYERRQIAADYVVENEFAYFSIEQGIEYAKGWLLASNIKKKQIICEV